MRINWSALVISALVALVWAGIVYAFTASTTASIIVLAVAFILTLFVMGIAYTARSDDD